MSWHISHLYWPILCHSAYSWNVTKSLYVIHSTNQLPTVTPRATSELSIILHFPFAAILKVSSFINVKINSTNLKTCGPLWLLTFPHSVFPRIKENTQLAGHINTGFKGNCLTVSDIYAIPSLNFLPIMRNYTPGILSSNYSTTKI